MRPRQVEKSLLLRGVTAVTCAGISAVRPCQPAAHQVDTKAGPYSLFTQDNTDICWSSGALNSGASVYTPRRSRHTTPCRAKLCSRLTIDRRFPLLPKVCRTSSKVKSG